MSWDATRRQVRLLEGRLDGALNQYSRIAGDIAQGGSSSSTGPSGSISSSAALSAYRAAEEGHGPRSGRGASGHGLEKLLETRETLEADLARMLAELSEADDKLATALDDPMLPPSTAMQHVLQRHREVLVDFERDFHRSRANIQQSLERRDLLGSVKIDIENHKAQHASDTDALLAERSRLDNSHRMIDGTLDQAYATRADLSSQRATLSDMSKRMNDTASRIPGLNNVIRLISRRRQRDRIIMGVVIGTCTVLLFMYLVR